MAITVKGSKEIKEALAYVAEAYGLGSDEEAVEKCILGFYGRKKALDTHSGKVAKVKKAKDAGKALPANVKFKRYRPTFTEAKLDAEGTDKEIGKWAHHAPERPEAKRVVDKGGAKIAVE